MAQSSLAVLAEPFLLTLLWHGHYPSEMDSVKCRSLFLIMVLCCFIVSPARAQIGWTAQQIEAKYGKPTYTKKFGQKSLHAKYEIKSDTSPYLASFSSAMSITYFDGKAEEADIEANLLPSQIDGQGTEIALSFVEQHPDLNTVRKRVRTASGGIEFQYKEYVVDIQKAGIRISPIVGTTLWNEMRKDDEIAVENIRKQEDAKQSNEFH